MVQPRNIVLLLAGLALILTASMCGLGASQSGAPAPLPTEALNIPSGQGAALTQQALANVTPAAAPAEPTQAPAQTSVPVILLPSPTAAAEATARPPAPEIPESRRVTLEYPPRIRSGDSDIVRLTLEVDTLGNVTPTAETKGNVVTGQTVQIPNLYDTHDVIAEARLDLAGVDVRPGDEISSPLLPGQSVTFYWSVQPIGSGTFRGTAWLFLRFVDKVTKAESRRPLSAQPLEISTTDLLGISGGLARTAGGVGSIVGAVLGFPFADDILKWLWKRVRKGS